MTRKDLLIEFRAVTGDKVTPYAWPDARVLRWLTEGEDRFCELTGFFADVGSYQITTEDGVKDYAIPSFGRIIEIKNVWDGDKRLSKFNQGDRPHTQAFTETPIRPMHYQTDKNTGFLTLFELPVAGVVLDLEVWRKAKTPLSAAAAPEIPDEFHPALVEYAAWRAYNDHDCEKLDLKKAADHMAEFTDYVSMGKRAFSRLHRQSPKVVPSPFYIV